MTFCTGKASRNSNAGSPSAETPNTTSPNTKFLNAPVLNGSSQPVGVGPARSAQRRWSILNRFSCIAVAWGTAGLVALSPTLAPAQETPAQQPPAQEIRPQAEPAGPVDIGVRETMLKKPDGEVARVKTKYNDIEIAKWRHELVLSFHVRGSGHIESIINLRDPDELPLHYTRKMTAALAYPENPQRILMVGLGGGSISTYLARHMPNLRIDAVDIDPGVIDVAKNYFELRQTDKVRFFVNDGRVFVRRASEPYDIIVMDAFLGAAVPFHLLTREFYALLREKLTPTGVAVFNVHEGTRFYLSTLKTLASVFGGIHLYPSGRGEMIVVALPEPAPNVETIKTRAAALQETYKFRYALPELVERLAATPNFSDAVLLTDEFAPVDLQGMVNGSGKNRK